MASVATLGPSTFNCGPVHLTGMTPSRDQLAIFFPSRVSAVISPVLRLTSPAMLENHEATFAESPLMGRVSLMFVYLMRPGSWWMKRFCPPSSCCSTTTSQPRPSHWVNTPRS